MRQTPRILAHRGASGVAVENSLDAFRQAITLGADGVELDIHATRDHALVVHHDPSVDGFGDIREHSLDELRAQRLANGEPVPTLTEALDVLGDHEVWVEVKALPPAADEVLFHALRGGPRGAGAETERSEGVSVTHQSRSAASADSSSARLFPTECGLVPRER